MLGGFIKGVAKLAVGTAVTAGVAAGAAYAAQKPVTEFACGQIDAHSELDSDHCIKAVAVKMRNASMCNSITGKRFEAEIEGKKVQLENPPKMECLTQVAIATNNPSLCDQVEGVLIANTKIDCLYRVAYENGNPTACSGIGDDTQSRAGSEMSRSGCLAAAARAPKQNLTAPVTPPPAKEPEVPAAAVATAAQTEQCQEGGGTGFDAKSGQCACPAGAAPQGATGCACEVKATGVLYGVFGIGSSTWHQLRPGEECGWWKGIGGIGENLGKAKRECYAGGGTGYDPIDSVCACPLGAHWNEKDKRCLCSAGVAGATGRSALQQGEKCVVSN